MLIAPRESGRRAVDFEIGTPVLARPATASRPIYGTVAETSDPYTLIVAAGGLQIAVDVEDCEAPPTSHRDGWGGRLSAV